MKKKIIPVLLSVLIILCSLPLTVSADTSATVVAENCSTSQGGYAYLNLRADNFVNVAVLDVEVFYNSDLMSVHYISNGSFLSGASVSTNKDNPGVVKISAMSASGMNSTTSTGNNRMMTICFKVNADCPVGKYPITVAVGDAYDNELNPTAISGQGGTIAVTEAAAQTFPLSTTANSTAKQNDIWSLKVYHSSSTSYSFASADFQVEYDREHFALDSVELAAALKKDDAVYSINTSVQGIVIISYAATTAVATSDLFTVKLKAIAEEDVSTKVKVTASDVYNDDLVPYSSTTVTKTVALTAAEALPDYPDLYLTEGKFIVGQQETLSLVLEGGAPVAAGDFTVAYDPTVFRCDDVSSSERAVQKGATIIINKNYQEGTIKFSYVNQNGSVDEDLPLIIIKLTPLKAPSTHFSITVASADVCDIAFKDVTLENTNLSDCVFAVNVKEPTCSEAGFTTYTCPCGESFTDDYKEKLPHVYDNDCDAICNNCNEAREVAGHRYENSDTVCDLCGSVRTISSISVTKLPAKVNYLQYLEEFDPAGTEVTITYSDSATKLADFGQLAFTGFDKNTLGTQVVAVDYQGYKTSFEVTVSALGNAPHKKLYRIGLIEPWRLRICARMTDSASKTLDYSTFVDYGAFVIRKSLLCDINTDISNITPDMLIENEHTTAYTKADGSMYIDGNYICVDFNKEIYTYRLNEPIVWMMYYKTADGTYATEVAEKNLLELIESRMDSTSSTYTELEKRVYRAMYTLYNTVTDYRSDFDSPSLIKMQTPPTINTTEVQFDEPATDELVKFKRLQQIRLVEPWGIVLNMRAYLSKDEGNSNAHIDYSAADDFGLVVYHDINDTVASAEDMNERGELLSHSDSDNVYVFSNSHGDMQLNGKYAYALYNKNIFTYQLDSEMYYMFFVKYEGKTYYSNVYETNIRTLTADRAVSTSTTYTAKEKLVYRDMVAMCDDITAYREDYFANH